MSSEYRKKLTLDKVCVHEDVWLKVGLEGYMDGTLKVCVKKQHSDHGLSWKTFLSADSVYEGAH